MSSIKKYLNFENRRLLKNYFRPSSYNSHPELKVSKVPEKRWKMLMTMRDLRLWMNEHAPFSSRNHIYQAELYQINSEINYLQMRAMLFPLFVWIGLTIFAAYWGPKHWNGAMGVHGRPNIIGETGGFSVMHDGCVPKLTTNDISEIMGI